MPYDNNSVVAAFLCFSSNRRTVSGKLSIFEHPKTKISSYASCVLHRIQDLCITTSHSNVSLLAPSLKLKEIPLCHVKYKSK